MVEKQDVDRMALSGFGDGLIEIRFTVAFLDAFAAAVTTEAQRPAYARELKDHPVHQAILGEWVRRNDGWGGHTREEIVSGWRETLAAIASGSKSK